MANDQTTHISKVKPGLDLAFVIDIFKCLARVFYFISKIKLIVVLRIDPIIIQMMLSKVSVKLLPFFHVRTQRQNAALKRFDPITLQYILKITNLKNICIRKAAHHIEEAAVFTRLCPALQPSLKIFKRQTGLMMIPIVEMVVILFTDITHHTTGSQGQNDLVFIHKVSALQDPVIFALNNIRHICSKGGTAIINRSRYVDKTPSGRHQFLKLIRIKQFYFITKNVLKTIPGKIGHTIQTAQFKNTAVKQTDGVFILHHGLIWDFKTVRRSLICNIMNSFYPAFTVPPSF